MSDEKRSARSPNPPAPNLDPGKGALLFAILSGTVAGLFIVYGVFLVPFSWFGMATSLYGLINLIVLGCAYRSQARWCVTAVQIAATGYLLIYVLALTLDNETGLGTSGILVVALALWCNWFAVTKIIRR